MSKEFKRFPKIRRIEHVRIDVKHTARFIRVDENEQVIYDESRPLPTLTYYGLAKMHGSNAGVVKDLEDNSFYAQSRNRIIDTSSDNYGFAAHVERVKPEVWNIIFDWIEKNIGFGVETEVRIFGERIGPGVQKKVGISNISGKVFVAFGFCVGYGDDAVVVHIENMPSFFELSPLLQENGIYSITDLSPEYKVTIDFNDHEKGYAQALEMMQEVANSCPVAKALGVEGPGEGIVWRCRDPKWSDMRFWFKTVSESFTTAISEKKTLTPQQKAQHSVLENFASEVLTERRMEQGIEYLLEMGIPLTQKSTGQFVRWVSNDVLEEEQERMNSAGITKRQASKAVGKTCGRWFNRRIIRC